MTHGLYLRNDNSLISNYLEFEECLATTPKFLFTRVFNKIFLFFLKKERKEENWGKNRNVYLHVACVLCKYSKNKSP